MTERRDVLSNPVVATASRFVMGLPVVGPLVRRGVEEVTAVATAIVVQIVEHIVAELDVDAIAAEIDIDAIVDRIDLVGLANKVIDGVDLPAIIRDSTNSVTAEVMTDVRSQGERADDVIAGMVDRALRRNRDVAE